MNTKGQTLTQSHWLAKLLGITPGLLFTFACLMLAAAHAQPQGASPGAPSPVSLLDKDGRISAPLLDDDGRVVRGDNPPLLTNKQKKSIMRSNFEKSKRDAAELAALASQLREELDKPNVDTLSLEGMNRIEKIEKLAKKIRDEMKGY